MSAPQYRVTVTGRKAWQTKDVAVPSDYRTILWVMDVHGPRQVESLLRFFSEELLSGCLAEMEELKLLERFAGLDDDQSESPGVSADVTPIVAMTPDDLLFANDSLSSRGAYLSDERLKGRRASAKAPSETAILIVEDDPDQLALADVRVSMAGYVVRVANSQAALLRSMAEEGMPDLILLDVTLPDGNGFDILATLRTLPSFAPLPIVMLTAKTDPNDIVRGLSLGADGYITKPYSKEVLAKVISYVLQSA